MSKSGRRQFLLQGLGAAAILSPLGSLAFGQTAQGARGAQAGRGVAPPTGRGGAAPAFDLVIKGRKVIQPTQKISSVMVDAKAAIDTIEQNRPYILGVKVRINGKHEDLAHDIEVLKKAREAADATRTLIMMHWTNEPDLIALLKRGDILTHPFNPPSPNSSNLMGGEPGKILPIVLTLKDRGIWTDFSHGGHLAWPVAEASAKLGWFPDT